MGPAEVPKMQRKKQWCYLGVLPCIQKAPGPVCGTYSPPWTGALGWLTARGSSHTFSPLRSSSGVQGSTAESDPTNYPFLTHKGSKTREKPCNGLPRSVLNSYLLLLNLREFKHFSYQIILKLVRHRVYSTANTAPFRSHFRGQEECLYNATATFEAHKTNWRVLRCAEGKGVGGLTDDKQWRISWSAPSVASFVASGTKAARSKLFKDLKNNCV